MGGQVFKRSGTARPCAKIQPQYSRLYECCRFDPAYLWPSAVAVAGPSCGEGVFQRSWSRCEDQSVGVDTIDLSQPLKLPCAVAFAQALAISLGEPHGKVKHECSQK